MKREEKTILDEIIEICNKPSKKEAPLISVKKRIGENLFKIRRKKKMSLTKASDLSGIRRAQLDWLERGEGCMNLKKLIKIANSYEVDIHDLLK